ncbi:prolipoprotein diacylglyceryl transferase [Bartonella sp. DGB2]|uniref:prolipoprotein diacylglyceryl transferase n=1 Tax=Bartonella sp. DGB2 TaxID=3388426 RepID=UPI00398FF0FB
MLTCPAISFPDFIDPVIFHLGPIAIHWYGVGYIAGILFAWWYSSKLLGKLQLWPNNTPPMSTKLLGDFVTWAALGVVIGGRLGQVLMWSPSYYFQHPFKIFAIWDGGMSFHGGLVGTIIAMVLFARKHRIPIWAMFDTIAAGVPVGLGIVRLCNFINQELWGNVTYNIPWAICYPRDPLYLPRHPSQLYEAGLEGLGLFTLLAIAIFIFKALKYRGLVAGLFVFFYAAARTATEAFRAPMEDPIWFRTLFPHGTFTYGMALSLPLFIIGLYAFVQATRFKSK